MMAEYRVYKIKGGHIDEPPVVFEAASDDLAAARASQLVDGVDVELWQGPRLVMGFKGSDSKYAAPGGLAGNDRARQRAAVSTPTLVSEGGPVTATANWSPAKGTSRNG